MGTFRFKSDLRNHQAIVQPRLYDSLMVTQITLKTEGPHGSESSPLFLTRAPIWPPGRQQGPTIFQVPGHVTNALKVALSSALISLP